MPTEAILLWPNFFSHFVQTPAHIQLDKKITFRHTRREKKRHNIFLYRLQRVDNQRAHVRLVAFIQYTIEWLKARGHISYASGLVMNDLAENAYQTGTLTQTVSATNDCSNAGLKRITSIPRYRPKVTSTSDAASCTLDIKTRLRVYLLQRVVDCELWCTYFNVVFMAASNPACVCLCGFCWHTVHVFEKLQLLQWGRTADSEMCHSWWCNPKWIAFVSRPALLHVTKHVLCESISNSGFIYASRYYCKL